MQSINILSHKVTEINAINLRDLRNVTFLCDDMCCYAIIPQLTEFRQHNIGLYIITPDV